MSRTKGLVFTDVADYLAGEANATILYLTLGTAMQMDRGELRADDPLTTLKMLGKAAGLEVEIASPGYWVIGPPDYLPSSGLTLSVQPLDPAGQGFKSAAEIGAIEKAFVKQLPVRDTGNSRGKMALNVGYYRIPEGEPETWLVLSSLSWVGSSNPNSPFFRVFKVGVTRTNGEIGVECLWASLDATGRLVPEIAEDFDGDGVRDFVFQGAGDKHPNVILSGTTGQALLTFVGGELAVEKVAAGPKRFAVDTLIGVTTEGESSRDPEAWDEGPFVLKYDSSSSDYEVQEEADLRGQAESVVQAPGGQFNGPRKLLARALGGTHKMRVYLLAPGVSYGGGGAYEEVPQQRYSWDVEVTPQAVAKGYPARILFRYESGGLVQKRKLDDELRMRQPQP